MQGHLQGHSRRACPLGHQPTGPQLPTLLLALATQDGDLGIVCPGAQDKGPQGTGGDVTSLEEGDVVILNRSWGQAEAEEGLVLGEDMQRDRGRT